MSINSEVLFERSTVGLISATSNNVTIKPMNFDVNDEWILQQVKTRRSIIYPINIRESDKLKENNDEKLEELPNCIETKQNTITKNSHDKGLRKKWTFILFDLTFCMIIATPMVVIYWMTTWSLMDRYHIPGDVIFVGGMAIHWTIAFFKNRLHESAMNALVRVQEDLATRILWKIKQIIYTYCFAIATIMHWRGGWIVFDEYFLDKFGGCMYMTAIMIGTLAVFRSLRNLIITPTSLYVDTLEHTFDFPTRYRVSTRNWLLYLLDCAFSVVVVGTLVVFVWRGVWILFDIYLFPTDRELSAIGSLVIGYIIVVVTFSLQPLMRYMCARLSLVARLIPADLFLMLSFLGTVNVWRGIWGLLDLWLLPESPVLSCWITHVSCFVILVLLNCSNSVLVRGVYIDAEEDDGKCVAFPCHYLRLFFKIEREKKEARRRNLLVASSDFKPRPDGPTKDAESGALLPNNTPTTILPANPESFV